MASDRRGFHLRTAGSAAFVACFAQGKLTVGAQHYTDQPARASVCTSRMFMVNPSRRVRAADLRQVQAEWRTLGMDAEADGWRGRQAGSWTNAMLGAAAGFIWYFNAGDTV